MNVLISILLAMFIVSMISFIGVLTMALSKKSLDKILVTIIAFAAGALIWSAFLRLIPEASEKEKLRRFIKDILITRGKIRKNNWIIRIISKEENNLITLQKELNRLFGVESKVNKRINGVGTIYFEMDINKKEQVKKLIELNFLSNEAKEKWLKLQK